MKVKDKSIYIGENHINFEFSVKKTLAFREQLYVLLDIPEIVFNNENVFCINRNCEIIWRIPLKKYPKENCPFTNMEKCGNNICLYNRCGIEIILDPLSNEIISEDLIK